MKVNQLRIDEYWATVVCNECNTSFQAICKVGESRHQQEECPKCGKISSTKVWP